MTAPVFTLKTVAVREDGCFSALLHDGQPFAVTCERTFDGAKPVIRNGRYLCKRTQYHKGGYETYEVMVPGHSRVLLHRGNKEEDSEACVLVAESFAVMDGQTVIGDSKGGFTEFMDRAGGVDEFWLEVEGR